jgi:hypothetical protein
MRIGLLVPAIMATNAASHAGQTILFRDYSPGTLTGLGLNNSYAIYLYRRAVREGYLWPDQLRTMLFRGALLMAPSAFALQLIGGMIARRLP